MFACKNCKSHKIKTRTNKTSGTKSSTVPAWCKACGSTEIEVVTSKFGGRGRRGPPRRGPPKR